MLDRADVAPPASPGFIDSKDAKGQCQNADTRTAEIQARLVATLHIGTVATPLTFSAPQRLRWSEREVIFDLACGCTLRWAR
jgi:hypothetical protein